MPVYALALYAQAAQPEAGSGELVSNTDIVKLIADASPTEQTSHWLRTEEKRLCKWLKNQLLTAWPKKDEPDS